jgi:integrase
MISRIDRRPKKNGKVSWRVRVFKGLDVAGKKIQDSSTFGTKGEAEEFVKALNNSRREQPISGVLTLDEYLDSWPETVRTTKAYYTWRRYVTLVRPIREALGGKRIDKLTAIEFEGVYSKMYESLSAKSVHHAHDAVRSALNSAVKKKLLAFNPMLACELRKVEETEAHAIDREQIGQLLEAAKGWLAVAIRLGADLGCRRGELCALRWQDIGPDSRMRVWRSVCQRDDGSLFLKSTKGGKGRHILLSPNTISFLDIHRDEQRATARLFGKDYRADLDLILSGPDGDFMKPQTLTVTMGRFAKRVGIQAGVHTLRHSHASILLSSGAPLAAVSKRLGHSKVSTTTDRYSHVLPQDEQKIIDILDRPTAPKMGENGGTAPTQVKTGRKRPN